MPRPPARTPHTAGPEVDLGDVGLSAEMAAASGSLVVAVDAEGRIREFNRACEELTGRRREDVLGEPVWSIVAPPGKEDDVRLDFAAAAAGPLPRRRESQWRSADGTLRTICWSHSASTDEDGDVRHVIAVGEDVTAQRHAESALRRESERFRVAFEDAALGMTVADLGGRYVAANDAFGRLVDRSAGEIPTLGMADLVHEDDLEAAQEHLAGVLAGTVRRPSLELRYRRPDGSSVWARLHGSALRDDGGRPIGWLGQVQEITAERRAAGDLRDAEQRFRGAFDRSPIGMALVGLDGSWLRANAALVGIVGYDEETLRALTFRDITHPDDIADDLELFEDAVAGRRDGYETVKRYRHADGSWLWIELSATLLRSDGGRPLYFLAQIRDVTERRRTEDRLAALALHDPLTGLPNRIVFHERLRGALARAGRRRTPVPVLFCDLDRFKLVNDSLGHAAGDEVLREAARRITQLLRPGDVVARLGGDEFTVLLDEETEEGTAIAIAERLLAGFEEPYRIDGRSVQIGMSIGVGFGGPGDDAERLLHNADAAMYRAKERGRGRIQVFDADIHDRAVRHLEIEAGLRRALQPPGALVVHYQPKVRLADGAILDAEALVRWQHPEQGLLPPSAFLDVAEESGLVGELGAQVLRSACAAAASWPAGLDGRLPGVGVKNASAPQLADARFCGVVERVLDRTGLAPALLAVEITESAVVASDSLGRTLDGLAGMGVRLAIDDFGTGRAAYAYLRAYPVDEIKIDRSFVRELGTNPKSSGVVASIMTLAQALELTAIAEGVETEQQRAELVALGCSAGQGYLFAPPAPLG